MQTEETPDRPSEEPQTEHHFETPVVRETGPRPGTDEERDDGDDAGAEQGRPQEREMAASEGPVAAPARRPRTSAARMASGPARR
jgi:hypothetical protein